jgi:prepilin-type N-terminal cleavage/methylation domain-containing protein
MRKNRGFSLVELMVVISIIVILISFILPAMKSASLMTETIGCQNNQHLLSLAFIAYAQEHNGVMTKLRHNLNSGAWITSAQDDAAIRAGTLWPYTRDVMIYKCPASKMGYPVDYAGCGTIAGEPGWNYDPWRFPPKNINSIPLPGQQMLWIEEADPRGRLVGSWVTNPYPSWKWVDYVAVYHSGGDNVPFLDGHVEHWQYQDTRTLDFAKSYTDRNFFATHVGSVDFRRYQAAYNPMGDNQR